MTLTRNIKDLIMTFLLIVIALALTPTIQQQCMAAVAGATPTTPNLTGAAATLCGLIPLFWVILVLAVGTVAIYIEFKGSD